MEYCKIMTESAMSADSNILSVRSAAWHDGWGSSFYCTTTGLHGWERGSSASCGVTVIATDGKNTEMGGHGIESRRFDELDIRNTALKAVEKTVAALGGWPMKTGPYTIVIEPETAASLVDVIGDLFCAPDIHKGRSMMKDRLGTQVASSCVTLRDDGRIPWKAGTSSWDAEGVPTGRTLLIEDGIARSYLYNLQYAWKDGVSSTGNACRGMSSLPDVGASNLLLDAGSETAESLISGVRSGLYLTELMGLHTIDPISGDFSVGAKGLLIESGKITRPVSGVTIASNLMDFLKNIVAVGSDLIFFGSTAAPTLVVENIVIAGE
jgi:PmbA protein